MHLSKMQGSAFSSGLQMTPNSGNLLLCPNRTAMQRDRRDGPTAVCSRDVQQYLGLYQEHSQQTEGRVLVR